MTARTDTDWPRVIGLYLCGVGGGLQFAKASVVFDLLAQHYGARGALAGWLVSTVGVAASCSARPRACSSPDGARGAA